MMLRDDVDLSNVDWTDLARLARRDAEKLPPGPRRDAEIDRALACEALAHSANLLLQTQME
jgi:ABC-type branched-subunit amino acid transport system ATPase component